MWGIRKFFFIFLLSLKIAAQSADELTPQQAERYITAVTNYTRDIKVRYPREDEEKLILPKEFFTLKYVDSMASFTLSDFYPNALDSLLALPPSGEKYVVDSFFVNCVAHLQGVRSVINDDSRFHQYNAQNTVWAHWQLVRMPYVPELCSFEFPGEKEAGDLCYLEQPSDPDLFMCDINLEPLAKQELTQEQKTITQIKYPSPFMQEFSVTMINDRDCIYLGKQNGPEPLESVVRKLVERFNRDLSEREIAYRGYNASTVAKLNLIRYRNPDVATTTMCAQAKFYKPNFSSVLRFLRKI